MFEIIFLVRGYRVCKDIWEVQISTELPCSPEPDNREDRHTVAILQLF